MYDLINLVKLLKKFFFNESLVIILEKSGIFAVI